MEPSSDHQCNTKKICTKCNEKKLNDFQDIDEHEKIIMCKNGQKLTLNSLPGEGDKCTKFLSLVQPSQWPKGACNKIINYKKILELTDKQTI